MFLIRIVIVIDAVIPFLGSFHCPRILSDPICTEDKRRMLAHNFLHCHKQSNDGESQMEMLTFYDTFQ